MLRALLTWECGIEEVSRHSSSAAVPTKPRYLPPPHHLPIARCCYRVCYEQPQRRAEWLPRIHALSEACSSDNAFTIICVSITPSSSCRPNVSIRLCSVFQDLVATRRVSAPCQQPVSQDIGGFSSRRCCDEVSKNHTPQHGMTMRVR